MAALLLVLGFLLIGVGTFAYDWRLGVCAVGVIALFAGSDLASPDK